MRSWYLSTLALLPALASASNTPLLMRADTSTSDTCANLVNVQLAVSPSPVIRPVTIGVINGCLCLSGINAFESSNIVAKAAVALAGVPETTVELTRLVDAHGTVCTYPPNSEPQCLPSKPCSFSCTNGFALDSSGSTCECLAPNVVCDGVCASSCPGTTPTDTLTSTPTDTPTDTPTSSPTDTPTNTPADTPTDTPTSTPTDTPTNTPTDTPTGTPTDTPTEPSPPFTTPTPSTLPRAVRLALYERRAAQSCPRGTTACGAARARRTGLGQPYECVDTQRALESCGGCVVPFGGARASGVDCTALPGVEDVACVRGVCVVSRCVEGWVVVEDGTGCVVV